MRRILLAVMSTITAVVLLFGYRTSTSHPSTSPTVAAAGAAGGTGSAGSAASGTTTPSAPTTGSGTGEGTSGSTGTTGSASSTRTVTGQAVQTRWGLVQVQITVSGSRITAVQPVQVPSENPRDVEINDYAVPVLTQEALAAQSARIDAVSGATVTSDGYIGSLQSALDAAGL